MSTVFAVMKETTMMPILLRKNGGELQWLPGGNTFGLSDSQELHALDNTNQGLDRVGDIRKAGLLIEAPEYTDSMHAIVKEFTTSINTKENNMNTANTNKKAEILGLFGTETFRMAMTMVQAKTDSDTVAALTLAKIFTDADITEDTADLVDMFKSPTALVDTLALWEVDTLIIRAKLFKILADDFEVAVVPEVEVIVNVNIMDIEVEVEVMGNTEYLGGGMVNTDINLTVPAGLSDMELEERVNDELYQFVEFNFGWIEIQSSDERL